MIGESYVSFDTAKMLKEAGFNITIRSYYTQSGSKWETVVPESVEDRNGIVWFPRPTQALAARWLREAHRIVVDATFIPPSTDGDVWQYFIGEMDDMVCRKEYIGKRNKILEEAEFITENTEIGDDW